MHPAPSRRFGLPNRAKHEDVPMSLATRCPTCDTTFRVVQDQLKVSEGWVRCGRCSEVFNALEGLFDLERETAPQRPERAHEDAGDAGGAPQDIGKTGDGASSARFDSEAPPALDAATKPDAAAPSADPHGLDEDADPYLDEAWQLDSAEPAGAAARDSNRPDDSSQDDGGEDSTSLDAEIDAHLFGARRKVGRRTPAPHVRERDQLDFSDARFASDLMADAADSELPDDAPRVARSSEVPLESAAPTPEFVRRAENRARWQRPRMRAALGLAALLLVAGLVLQVGNHFRDLVAARWPVLAGPLAEWCLLASCTIEAPRRIEDISVESTALARAPGNDTFRLAVTLRSRARVAVALPWIDLSLTDASGKLVARKAIAARELDPLAMLLQPGAEMALQTLLTARDAQVAGYTVEIFYP
jgi:predicted Zn finger-like uncharacterized protein